MIATTTRLGPAFGFTLIVPSVFVLAEGFPGLSVSRR